MSDTLPELPHHPEHNWVWTALEQQAILAYGESCYSAGIEAGRAQAVDVSAIERELIIECERAIKQHAEFLLTGVSTAAHGGSHDTCFGHILRKHLAAHPPERAEPVAPAFGIIDPDYARVTSRPEVE